VRVVVAASRRVFGRLRACRACGVLYCGQLRVNVTSRQRGASLASRVRVLIPNNHTIREKLSALVGVGRKWDTLTKLDWLKLDSFLRVHFPERFRDSQEDAGLSLACLSRNAAACWVRVGSVRVRPCVCRSVFAQQLVVVLASQGKAPRAEATLTPAQV
jgi:hypothetical protein